MRKNWTIDAAMVVAIVIGWTSQAHADVIDGNWCSDDGRHFSINGPTIVTTQGVKTTGNYSRHAFSYTIPDTEPSAGQQVFMILLNERTVRLRVGADPATPTEIWKRCDVIS